MPVRGRNGGNAGQGSKWISKKTRHRIYARDVWKCVWCGTEVTSPQQDDYIHGVDEPATLDHVIPRSCGGTNVVSNLITCCMRCNRKRGDCIATTMAEREWWNTSKGTEQRTYIIETLRRILDAVCKPLPPAQ